MRLKIKSILCLLFLCYVTMANSRNIPQKDIYGQVVLTEDGERLNHPQSVMKELQNSVQPKMFPVSTDAISIVNSNKSAMTAKVDNLFSIMGTSIGRNSMHSLDIDKDGNTELICSATTQGFGLGNFWYIMNYDSSTQTWNQTWTSKVYTTNIKTIEIVDYNNDNNYEILLGFSNGTIEIYNPVTKELVKSFNVLSEAVNSIIYADADNDAIKDIVVAAPSNTYILDATTFEIKYTINKGANYVRVGILDNSNQNEIVLSSGYIYKLIGKTLTTEWNYNTSGEGYVELSDIDNDTKSEVIYAQSWYYIYVYDVDSRTTKYSIKSDLDIEALTMADTNNDGIDELFYGDGQWGSIYCHNSATGALMWSVNNPEHGVTAINYADLNNDGKKELVWGAGWTSTGADYLYIYSPTQSKTLWKSDDIVGPFYATATGDVDGDGKDEIVAVSYESESGYSSGILVILDAETNKLKWKSNGNFLYLVWTGLYDVCISDVDNDGNNEIIIGAGQTYTGEIWIVDGKNHTIKSNHIFSSPSTSEFYSLTVDDIDNDGLKELISVSSSTLYVIKPTDWSVKWSVSTGSTYSGTIVRSADINGNGNKEIIVCKNNLMIINTVDHSMWKSTESNYINFDLYDFNNDGVLDIIASTTNGRIVAIDGTTKSVINDINPETSSIVSVRAFKSNNSLYYIYSNNNSIKVYQNENNCSVSQSMGTNVGEVESMKLYNIKPSSTEIIFGTSTSIQRMYLNIMSASATLLNIGAEANSQVSVDIAALGNWDLDIDQDWLKANISSGNGNATITFTADVNEWAITRSASVVISGEGSTTLQLIVTQAGATPVLTVAQNTLEINAAQGSTNYIDISSNLTWTAVSNQSWLFLSSNQGTGDSKVVMTAYANPTILPRTAIITFSGNGLSPVTVTVTQAAGDPVLALSTNNLIISATANSTKSFSIYSNVSWTVTSNQTWLVPNISNGYNNATITLIAQQNVAVESRTAIITITGDNLAPVNIAVMQDASIPILNLSTNNVLLKANTGNINIQSNINWIIVSNQAWLTTDVTSGSRDATITLVAQRNNTSSIRAASLIISGVGVLPQAVTVIQDIDTGVDEASQNPTFIFPNAVSSEIKVNNLTENALVWVYDINGCLLGSKESDSSNITLHIDNLIKGIYIIRVKEGEKNFSQKFIIH